MTDTRTARPDILARLQAGGVYPAIVLLLLFNFAFTPNFATVPNLRLQLVQVAPVALVAIGMALVIATEGIDLSVGSTMAISAALLPLYLGYGVWPAIVIALLAGAAVGIVNGSLVAFAHMQPIIATLGTLVACRGLALVLADGRLTEMFDPVLGMLGNDSVLGVPISVLLVLVVTGTAVVDTPDRVRAAPAGRRRQPGRGHPRRSAGQAHPGHGLCRQRSTGRRRRCAQHRTAGGQRPLVGRTAHRTQRDHRRRRRRHPLSGGRVRILGTLMGALLMQLIIATVIQHDLPDSTARMLQAGIIVAAVYVQRGRSRA